MNLTKLLTEEEYKSQLKENGCTEEEIENAWYNAQQGRLIGNWRKYRK